MKTHIELRTNEMIEFCFVMDTWNRSISCNWTRTHNHLVRKWTLNHLAKLAKFESNWSHLNFRFSACFGQGVPWHSGNYRVWIHSERHTWYDKNIQSIDFHSVLFVNIFKSKKIHVAIMLPHKLPSCYGKYTCKSVLFRGMLPLFLKKNI